MNNTTTTKELIKIMFIYQALEKGWTVKKCKNYNSFEFIRSSTSHNPSGYNKPILDLKPRRVVSDPIIRYL